MKLKFLALTLLLWPVLTFAQATPAPASSSAQTFSFNAVALSLPGGKSTVAGTDAGVTFRLTTNFQLREDNIVAPGDNMTAFLGGFNYHIPALSTKLNNVSENLNGLNFDFYTTGGFGVDRLSAPTSAQHYAGFAGGGFNYKIAGSSTWSFGAEVTADFLPGVPTHGNWTWSAKIGPSINF